MRDAGQVKLHHSSLSLLLLFFSFCPLYSFRCCCCFIYDSVYLHHHLWLKQPSADVLYALSPAVFTYIIYFVLCIRRDDDTQYALPWHLVFRLAGRPPMGGESKSALLSCATERKNVIKTNNFTSLPLFSFLRVPGDYEIWNRDGRHDRHTYSHCT